MSGYNDSTTPCRYRILKAFSRSGKVILVILIFAGVFMLSLSMGRYPVSVRDILHTLLYLGDVGEPEKIVIINLRLPRILGAVIVGTSLSVAGAVYQAVFKNPMVSPSILGAQAGAGFGAAIGILLSLPQTGVQLVSFISGLLAVGISVFIARVVRGYDQDLILVLAGVFTGTFFTALISLIKFVADPYQKLPEITFWLMGSLSSMKMHGIGKMVIPFSAGLFPVFYFRYHLNILSLGDTQAKALGLDTGKFRFLFIVSASLLTSMAVSVSGLIGWIGLMIPHIARFITGPDNRKMLPLSAVLGGIYLLCVDDIARCAFHYEIPLGILTALIGCPFFMYLMMKKRECEQC